MLFGTVAGGVGASLTGGDFWFGAAQGFVVSSLNHVAHMGDGDDIDPPGKKAKSKKTIAEIRKEIMAKESAEQDNNYNFFYTEKDNILRFGADYLDDGGASANTIAINTHGNEDIIVTPTGPFNAKNLHDYLFKHNNLYRSSLINGTKITVKIMACNSGNGFAKIFSTYNPNATVIGPSSFIHNAAGFNYMKDGSYLKFNNGKIIK